MPQGTVVSDDIKLDVMELIEKGVPQAEIARQVHLAQSTVSRIKKEFYGKDRRDMDCVIAGNKKFGLLTATGPNHYVGTCLTKNGKMKKRHFNIQGSKEAIRQWEEWKRLNGVSETDISEPIKVEKKPQRKEAPVSEPIVTKSMSEPIVTNPVTNPVINPQQSDASTDLPTAIFCIAVGAPKILGFSTTEEDARDIMKRANQALEIAGVGDVRYSIIPVKLNQAD